MPVVVATDASEAELLVVVPRHHCSGVWTWDEVAVSTSKIDGYGLETRSTKHLDWAQLDEYTVLIPIVGMETEVDSAKEIDIFTNILQGACKIYAPSAV